MIDTNIILSAVLFPDGKASEAFSKAMLPPFRPVVSDYIPEELLNKFKEKFPSKLIELKQFLSLALKTISIVNTPEIPVSEERSIRDLKDRPIIRAALNCHVDYLLTGDKDFLESGFDMLNIISVSQFLLI